MSFQQQLKLPKRKNKITVDGKHSKILQGVIIDMIVHVGNMMVMTSLPYTKKKKSSPLRTRLDVLLATLRKLMRLGINHDKNKSKLPKLVVRTINLLLVRNCANKTSKLLKLVAKTKFHHQTRHLNNRKSNATITKQDMRARTMMMTAQIMATAATGTAMEKKLSASSNSPCPSSSVPMSPRNISLGNSRSTRSSACTTIAMRR